MNASPVTNPSLLHTSGQSGYEIRHITFRDLRDALRLGVQDWRACRTEVPVLAFITPVAAILLGAVLAAPNLLPFLFPVCSGFALLGPMITLWFAALSRERERSGTASAEAVADLFNSPRLATIQTLGLLTIALFLLWLAAAASLYAATLGSQGPVTGMNFFTKVFTTWAGWEMILLGHVIGAGFALVALGAGLVSFPLALDHDITPWDALAVSARAVIRNPLMTLAWGVVVAALMILGTLPALLGLAVVLPVLGHASWHIYRRLIV